MTSTSNWTNLSRLVELMSFNDIRHNKNSGFVNAAINICNALINGWLCLQSCNYLLVTSYNHMLQKMKYLASGL